jgi:hypothetical protein
VLLFIVDILATPRTAGMQPTVSDEKPFPGRSKLMTHHREKQPRFSLSWSCILAEAVSAFRDFQHWIAWDDMSTPRASF